MSIHNQIRNHRWRHTALAVALSMSLGGVAMAQSNATGTIFGSAGTPGSTVHVVNTDTGFSRDIQVDQSGRYRASSLPVGNYKVTLVQNGQEVSSRNVTLQVGGGVDASFASATQAQTLEGVSVVASALPAIDISQVDARTVLTSEMLSKIPVARSVTAAALLAPGTVASDSRYGNVASFGGSSAAENQYYVNGFPVTNSLTGLGFAELPFDSIDQQQVITGGYGAEYGRSTGGVVNLVTKSGTNEWKMGAQVVWAPRALKDSARSIYYPNNPSVKANQLYQDRSGNISNQTTYGAYVSGPLIKDKLFMYVTGEQNKTSGSDGLGSNQGAGSTRTDSTVKSTRWLAKINWNINDSNTLEATAMGDNNTEDFKYYDYDYDTGTTGDLIGSEKTKNMGTAGSTPGGSLYIGKYTGYLTDNLTVTALYGKTHSEHADSPLSATGIDCPLVIDARNVPTSQLYNTCWTATQVLAPGAKDDTKGWRLDVEYHLGDHSLRAGVDNQDISSFSGTSYAGTIYSRYMDLATAQANNLANEPGYTGATPQYVVRQRVFNAVANVSVKQEAQYIEDHWQVNDRWMAYLGLRNEQFSNYNGSGEVYVSQRHQLAPRLGVTWDVFGDSSFKVYANAGRYHLAIPANVAIRGASASLFSNQYFTYTGVDPATGAPTGTAPITGIRYLNGADGVTAPDPRTVAAKGLKAYYQDEYILGFDKTLGSDWTFGAKATYRNLKSIIDDMCDSAPFEAYAARTGTDISNALISGCYLFNPGGSNTFAVDMGDGTFQDFKLTEADFAGNSNGIGYPKLQRKYLSLNLYLTHQFSNNWYGKLDYVWSKNYGDSEGMLKSDIGQTDPSVTQDWDFPELMIGSRGYLPNDRRHQIKAYGYWQMNPEWLFGSSLQVASGRPKNCIGNPPGDYDRQGYGSSFFFCDFDVNGQPDSQFGSRGSKGRLPWTYQLNLSAQYTPAWADHKLAFTADVFNVFTQQRKVSIVETQSSETDANYGRVLSYQTPRTVRLGVRYDFSL
jgi:hypothetical protein